MPITHVQLFSVPVSDQDRARDFYVDTLGFTLVSDMRMDENMRWVLVAPPGAATAITLVTWFPTMEPGSVKGMVFETDDLEASIEDLRAAAVETSEIETAPWGRFTQLSDPDGNGIVLQTSTPMPQ
jgi:catechol 2,3-dioxygenase-like lactoylglutathione lyase family enzyme